MKSHKFVLFGMLLTISVMAWAEQRPALTPLPPDQPRIHAPKVYGVRPGHPFIFRIPATGKRPLSFSAKGLPRGLKLDPETGVIQGKVRRPGTYPVILGAKNAWGKAAREFRIVVGDQIALTPPMGWATWYMSYTNISDAMVRAQASALLSTGLADHGYSYIDIDDGWNIKPQKTSADESPRDAQGNIKPGKAFPDMKALTTWAHQRGLKMGIYISPGSETCAEYTGSYQHERQDAETFARWGFDLLKYDLCSYTQQFLTGPDDMNVKKPYQQMGEILKSLDRDILYYICEYGFGDVWKWGREVGGNVWRTTGDLGNDHGGLWKNVVDIGFGQAGKEKWAGPGGWNDPDNFELGHILWKDKLQPTPLTPNEQYTHFTLWAISAAPLVIGGDLTQMDDFTLRLLGNDEVIAVDQDVLGKQGAPVWRSGDLEVWAKVMEGGAIAVAFFNRGGQETKVPVRWSDLGIQGKRQVRDLWRQQDLGVYDQELSLSVGEHGAELVLLQHQ
jgi:alpha-galactosidase